VIFLEIKDYAKLVEVTSLAERGIRELAAAYDMEKRTKQHMTYPAKRTAIESGSKPSVGKSRPPTVGNQRSPNKECGKAHSRKCINGSPNCFKCGKLGHISRNCPKNFTIGQQQPQGRRAQARVYSLILGNGENEDDSEKESTDVATGTIP